MTNRTHRFVSSLFFVLAWTALATAQSTAEIGASPAIADKRRAELAYMLRNRSEPPRGNGMFSLYQECFGGSEEDFVSDLYSIVSNTNLADDVRGNAFHFYARLRPDWETFWKLGVLTDKSEFVRHFGIKSALGAFQNTDTALAHSIELIRFYESTPEFEGDLGTVAAVWIGALHQNSANSELRQKIAMAYLPFYESTSAWAFCCADTVLLLANPELRQAKVRTDHLQYWATRTNDMPIGFSRYVATEYDKFKLEYEDSTVSPNDRPPDLFEVSPPAPTDPDSPSPEASSQQNRWVVIGFVALAAIVGIMATWRQRNFRTRKKTSKVS